MNNSNYDYKTPFNNFGTPNCQIYATNYHKNFVDIFVPNYEEFQCPLCNLLMIPTIMTDGATGNPVKVPNTLGCRKCPISITIHDCIWISNSDRIEKSHIGNMFVDLRDLSKSLFPKGTIYMAGRQNIILHPEAFISIETNHNKHFVWAKNWNAVFDFFKDALANKSVNVSQN